jgi:hypothetical protein
MSLNIDDQPFALVLSYPIHLPPPMFILDDSDRVGTCLAPIAMSVVRHLYHKDSGPERAPEERMDVAYPIFTKALKLWQWLWSIGKAGSLQFGETEPVAGETEVGTV